MNSVVKNGFSDIYFDVNYDIVNVKMSLPLYDAFSNVSGRPSIYLTYPRDVSLAYKKRADYIFMIATPKGKIEYDIRYSLNTSIYEKITRAILAYFNGNDFKYGGLNIYYEEPFGSDSIDAYYYGYLFIKALNAAYNEERIEKDTIIDCLSYAAEKVEGSTYDASLILAIANMKNAFIGVQNNKATFKEFDFPFEFDSYLLSFSDSNFLSPYKNKTEGLLKRINDMIFSGYRYAQIDKQDFHARLSVPIYDVDEITKLKAHILYDDIDYMLNVHLAIENKEESKFTTYLHNKTRRDIDMFYFDAPSKDKILVTYLLSNYPELCVYIPFPYSSSVIVLLRKGESITDKIDLKPFPDVRVMSLNDESED